MIEHQPLSREAVNLVAGRFRVLSEPLRLHILQYLEGGEASVTAITEAVDSTQPNVSKHLKILNDEGLVARRQDGNLAFYRIADESVFELCEVVCGSLKQRLSERNSIFG